MSYRREDSAGHAGRPGDHLLDRFGSGSVFMDVESIGAGADFTTEIESAIGQADAVQVLIDPGWLEARTASGSRRLNEPDDFVGEKLYAEYTEAFGTRRIQRLLRNDGHVGRPHGYP